VCHTQRAAVNSTVRLPQASAAPGRRACRILTAAAMGLGGAVSVALSADANVLAVGGSLQRISSLEARGCLSVIKGRGGE
jgi:hypothetical protein